MYTERASVRFAYIYWTIAELQRLSIDPVTLHVYATFHSQPYWQGTTGYTKYPAQTVCSLAGMYAVKIESKDEELAMDSAMFFGPAYIGATRYNATNFQWVAGGIIGSGYSNFAPGEPRNAWDANSAAEDCTYKLTGGPWRDGLCDTRRDSVACETDGWADSGVVVHTLSLNFESKLNKTVMKRIGTTPIFDTNLIFSQENFKQIPR